jgi:hypothetical protein
MVANMIFRWKSLTAALVLTLSIGTEAIAQRGGHFAFGAHPFIAHGRPVLAWHRVPAGRVALRHGPTLEEWSPLAFAVAANTFGAFYGDERDALILEPREAYDMPPAMLPKPMCFRPRQIWVGRIPKLTHLPRVVYGAPLPCGYRG